MSEMLEPLFDIVQFADRSGNLEGPSQAKR